MFPPVSPCEKWLQHPILDPVPLPASPLKFTPFWLSPSKMSTHNVLSESPTPQSHPGLPSTCGSAHSPFLLPLSSPSLLTWLFTSSSILPWQPSSCHHGRRGFPSYPAEIKDPLIPQGVWNSGLLSTNHEKRTWLREAAVRKNVRTLSAFTA